MRPVLLLVALAACAPEPPEACLPADAPWADFDADGFPASVDCNDSDPAIHPAAFERCDNLDNNCDDAIDEGYPVGADGFPDCGPAETCDGADNDYDGLVDEGFPDFDGDGRADCLDDACDTAPVDGDEIVIDEDCTGPSVEVVDPWNLRVEWTYGLPDGNGSAIMPAVGNLTDDDGDGRIDELDIPDIVVASFAFGSSTIYALQGDGSGLLWSFPGIHGNVGLALGDVDGDGLPEVLALANDGRAVAINHDGTEQWRSAFILDSLPSQGSPLGQIAVADLEGDGSVEVIVDAVILDGATGAVNARMVVSSAIQGRAPVVADLDTDGISEILLGDGAYRPDGTRKWDLPWTAPAISVFQAVADIDGDLGGESFWVTESGLYVLDDDGSLLHRTALPVSSYAPGPPTVADFTGDGTVEIAVPMNSELGMFEPDGTLLWSQRMVDFSGVAGASGYDVNGDGTYEVVFADEDALRIYDGPTGEIVYESREHTSVTLWEYPTIADVDRDGSAEIVVVTNGAPGTGVSVFGHAGDGWAEAGPVWANHDFCVTNVNPDLSIPSPAPLSWTAHNVFRARPVVDAIATDLYVQIADACVSSCTPGIGVAGLEFRVGNLGAMGVVSDIRVSIWSVEAGTDTLLEVVTVPGVAGGALSATQRVEVPIERIGSGGLRLRVDDDGRDPEAPSGRVSECDEENNETTWPYDVCG
jgi:outer membrane protein assembly factor BamB